MEATWIPVDDSFKKAYVEDWVFQITDPSDISFPGSQGDDIPETPKVSFPVSSSQREAPKPEVSNCAHEHVEAPLPPLQPRPTCERLELLFSRPLEASRGHDISQPFCMTACSRVRF